MDSLLLNIKSNWKIIQLEELIKINDPSQEIYHALLYLKEKYRLLNMLIGKRYSCHS